MIKRFRKLNAGGDTIVEVLIVLAVLGLALSISYATANQGLQKSRNAQEHSQALGIINSQVELLRSAFAKNGAGSLPAGPFCLAPPPTGSAASPTVLGTGPAGFQDDRALDHLNTTAYPGPCTQNSLYNVSIVNRGNDVFDFRVRWEGLGKLGRQQEQLTYKIDNIIPGIIGYSEPEAPPPPPLSGALSVIVQAIPPGPTGSATNPTPSCSSAGTNKSGTTVRINGSTGITSKTTDASSTAAFSGLQQGNTYSISVSRPGFGLCAGGASSAVASTSTPPPTVTKKIYPICPLVYNNYYTYSGPNGLSGYWKFGNSTPDTAYTQSYYDSKGVLHTLSYPNYLYFVGTGAYSGVYRYYYVYDALYHSNPNYPSCPS